jgi:hypothetical protein
MSEAPPTSVQDCSGRLIIAAFDGWQALRSALQPIHPGEMCCFKAVLHARTDVPRDSWLRECVNEVAKVDGTAWTRRRFARGDGVLVGAQARAFAQGARSLAMALRPWLSARQAADLQIHIERGRVLLWVQPADSEKFSCLCAHLVRSSPHVVFVGEDPIDPDGAQSGHRS